MKHIKHITVARAQLTDIFGIFDKVPTCISSFTNTILGAVTTLFTCITTPAS